MYIFLTVNDLNRQITRCLIENYYTIGRSTKCSIQLSSVYVSRIHARLFRHTWGRISTKYSYIIKDGDGNSPSANGLTINNKQVKEHTIVHGDRIYLAQGIYLEFNFVESDIQSDKKATLFDL